MNDNIFAVAARSLYGDMAGNLRAAWRRSAEQAGRSARRTFTRRQWRGRLFAVGAMLGAAALLPLGAAVTAGGPPNAVTTPAPGAAPDARLPQRHADAVQALRARRYAAAYGGFASLADEGHVPSAAMALLMVCHGAQLFGSEWSATPGQLQRWSAMALSDVRERAGVLVDHDRGE